MTNRDARLGDKHHFYPNKAHACASLYGLTRNEMAKRKSTAKSDACEKLNKFRHSSTVGS